MKRKLRGLVRIAHIGLLLCTQTAYAHQGLQSGIYVAGDRTIAFSGAAKFSYKGRSCFVGYSDAGLPDEFSGRYRLDGQWIMLEPINSSPFRGCSIDTRLYRTSVDGHAFLVEESYFQYVVNAQRSGKPVREIYPWHRPGEPDKFRIAPATWLPAPYAKLFKMPAPQGKVVAVDAGRKWMSYGAGGREDGMVAAARVTFDIGTQAGAFVGMSVCHPDVPNNRFEVRSVTRETSTLEWSWGVDTMWPTPTVGMPITTHCPVAP